MIKVGRWNKSTISDEDGYFTLKDLPSNEFLKISISADDYYVLNKKVTPNSKDIYFKLKPVKAKSQKIILKGINVIIEEEIQIEIDGNYLSYAEYKKYVEDNLKKEVHTLEELKSIWINDKKRQEFIKNLKTKNIDIDFVKELDKLNDVDGFDIIARIVFNAPLITKDERVKYFVNKYLPKIDKFGEDIRYITLMLLEKYKIGSLDDLTPKALKTPDMERLSAMQKLKLAFNLEKIPTYFNKIKERLFEIKETG